VATFVVGDVQGCFDSLEALIRRIQFDPAVDELWFVGDLVNRGPRNLEVLRYIRGLGDRASCVLGNHDLHLLARAAGVAPAKRLDTLDDVLEAPDRDELIEWLRRRPVVHRRGDDVMVHAGVLPEWTDAEIDALGGEMSAALAGDNWGEVIATVRTARSVKFGSARGLERLAAISAVLQRIRTLNREGEPAGYSGPASEAPEGCAPWFAVEHQRRPETRILFGHWSALGLMIRPDAVGLDTGCVWGRELTAFELETGQVVSVSARE
jgi:bis(5'-nucleosyl)-tetraphosphatase (symmetrical)